MDIQNWVWVGILGWLVGVLVNYFSDVLPWRRKPVKPFCISCKQNQKFLNYFLWPRVCPVCQQPRGLRCWLIEILFVLLSIWLWENHPQKLGYWGSLLILGYFGIVVVIDIEYRLILHPVSLFGVIIGLGTGTYLHGFIPAILGGALGFGSMLLLYWLGEGMLRIAAKIRGEVVDDVALGFGDVNLSGVLGLMLGFPAIVLGLFLAILLGGVASLIYLLLKIVTRRYQLFMALPYGPFLVSGAVLLLFFRDFLATLFR
jgi:leader peptidase (prepilin peptidase) / N-methyltransferase